MPPGKVACINKHLLKQRNDKQKQINEQTRKLRRSENKVRVYKDFTEGKLSKGELTTIIQKVEKEESELTQIKLRKVRIEKIKQESSANPFDNDSEDVSKPKSMKDLLAMFGGNSSS